MKKEGHSAISGGSVSGGKNSAFFILHSAFSSAFTLIELIVTIVIIGIVLLALVMSFHESLKLMVRQRDLRQSVVLCEDLMNEIRSKAFVDPVFTNSFGPAKTNENEGVRTNYDDVDDYNGLTDAPPHTAAGAIMSNFTGFTRRVFVGNVAATNFNAAISDDPTNDFKRITVVVSNAQFAVSSVSVVGRWD